MTEYASADDLLTESPDNAAEDFALPSGKVVRLRGLTRAEHLWIGKGTDDPAEIEARMMSKAFVSPVLTVAKAKEFQATAAAKTVSDISEKIQELSGFGEGAAKSDPEPTGE